MTLRFLYLAFCAVLWLLVCRRGDLAREGEIVILRHELAVLRPTAGRARLDWADRAVISALAKRSFARAVPGGDRNLMTKDKEFGRALEAATTKGERAKCRAEHEVDESEDHSAIVPTQPRRAPQPNRELELLRTSIPGRASCASESISAWLGSSEPSPTFPPRGDQTRALTERGRPHHCAAR